MMHSNPFQKLSNFTVNYFIITPIANHHGIKIADLMLICQEFERLTVIGLFTSVSRLSPTSISLLNVDLLSSGVENDNEKLEQLLSSNSQENTEECGADDADRT